MEAVIAEPPSEFSKPFRFVPQVDIRYGRVVVILHWAVIGDPDQSEGSALNRVLGRVYTNLGFSRELLQLRKIHLLDILQSALDSSPTVTGAVECTFRSMNNILRRAVGELHSAEAFWRVEHSSMVVIVQHEHVHVFGHAGGIVILSRDGKDKRLTPRPTVRLQDRIEENNSETKFRYYHKEKLTSLDSHLVVGTTHILHHCAGDFSPILLSRIKTFGLEKACKQVAGRHPDYPRSFVCVPIEDLESFKGEVEEPEPQPDWGLTGEKALREKVKRTVEKKMEKNEYWDSDDDGMSPCHNLFPLVNGKAQEPAPRTSCDRLVPRDPCIRTFDFRNYSEPVMVCKYHSCTLVIRRGDIVKWKVDGTSDAVVRVIGSSAFDEVAGPALESVRHGDMTSHVDLLPSTLMHVETPPPDKLSYTYKSVLSLALARGMKHIAFPGLFSSSVSSPTYDEEQTFKEAEEIIRVVIDHLGKVVFGSKKKKGRARIQVHFVLDSNEVWRAFVGATDQLSFWEREEKERRYEQGGLRLQM